MVIKEAISKAIGLFSESGIEQPVLDARVLMSKALGKGELFVITSPDYSLTAEEESLFFSYVKRRTEFEPVAYITGEKEFMSLNFYVNPSVLVPRPDTEHLAELAIGLVKEKGIVRAADFCTGTGALAIAIAKYCENVMVDAFDISDEALDVAEKNKNRHGAESVTLKKLDVLNSLHQLTDKYQLVVSNPPYINGDDMQRLQKTVAEYEPHIALYGGADGLDFYRAISKNAELFLEKGGTLAFEVGYNQHSQVQEIMSDNFSCLRTIKDYAGIERVVYGTYKGNG